MKRTTRFVLAIGAGLLWLSTSLPSEGASPDFESWPQFRGPDGMSVARDQEIPMDFGPDENELWSTSIPRGNSSPIIWRDHLFLSAYHDDKRIMLAIDRYDGSLIWERSVTAQSPEEFTHRLSGPAESTPCTDGKRVYFYFGNYGLIALNLDGSLAWEKQLRKPRTGMGTGTSPILIGNSLILIRDGTDDPCILSLDSSTGEEIWKRPRLGYTTSHSSPFVWKNKLQTELVIAGASSLVSLNPATGKLL